MGKSKDSKVLLSAATGTGAGTNTFLVENASRIVVYLTKATASAATVNIESKAPTGSWYVIHQEVFTTSGDKVMQFEGPYKEIRANVASIASGSVTVSADAHAN